MTGCSCFWAARSDRIRSASETQGEMESCLQQSLEIGPVADRSQREYTADACPSSSTTALLARLDRRCRRHDKWGTLLLPPAHKLLSELGWTLRACFTRSNNTGATGGTRDVHPGPRARRRREPCP